VKTRLLFLAVVTPLAAVGRPFWRRRLGLGFDPRARSYWRKRGETIGAEALRRLR
jgi:hypothetical protein